MKKKLIKAVGIAIQALEIKCGGQGGTPGPCPSGNSKPAASHGKKVDKGDYTEQVSKSGWKKVTDMEAKPGKTIPMDATVGAFQKMKKGASVSFTLGNTKLGDNNVIEGTVSAKYKFKEGLPWKGAGAVDIKTSSGETKRVSAVTKFHRIAMEE